MSENEQQASFSAWAKVEVMGHQSHIGYVRTEAYGAAVLFRIDTPELPEREYVLEEPEYVNANNGTTWAPAGSKVTRDATPGVSVLVGAGSIYRIVPCSESAALKAIESNRRSALWLVELPESRSLEEPIDAENGQDEEDGDYRIVPCSESAALKAIESNRQSALKLVELPESRSLEAPIDAEDGQDEKDGDEEDAF